MSLFYIISRDLTRNADIFYCYIHGYPYGSSGGFYLLDISHNDGQIHIFQCVVRHNAPLYVEGTLFLGIQPVGMVNQYLHQDLVDARRAFDNYKCDQFTQYTFGVNYESYMDQLIGSIIDFQDSHHCDNTERNYDLSQHANTDKESIVVVSTVDTRRSGIVNSPPCRDINYPDKVRGYLALEPTSFQFIGPDSSDNYLDVAQLIKQSGLPNYKQIRIPLKSGLCFESWKKYLLDYKDQKVLQYLQFGFPLSISQPELLDNQSPTNHFSALQFQEAVSLYLAKESSHGAMLGPVKSFGHHSGHKFVHCSPILTRPKGQNNRRVILDLSYPKGLSLNDQVDRSRFDGDLFSLKFPSIDYIVKEICSHKNDVVISKIDVARAFRNLRVDPADAVKLGIRWGNDVYIDVAVAFGWVHGSAAFQRVSDAVTFIMAQHGIKMFAYIDDYIMASPRAYSDAEFQRLASLLTELGLPSNPDKQTPPCRKLTCLGIQIDLDNNELSIDPDKLQSIHNECIATSGKRHLSRKAFQSLLGKLLYIHKCVPPARTFISRMLALFRQDPTAKRITLTEDFHKDLAWFLVFLPKFSGVTYIRKFEIPHSHTLYVDASLTGLGGIWNDEVYATPIFNVYQRTLKIVHFEMLNLVIALKLWAVQWSHSIVKFNCDNSAVVQVVRTGKTRDDMLALCLRNIWLITSTHDITLTIDHIRGKSNNIADLLSRVYSDKPVDQNLLSHLKDTHIWRKIPIHFFNLNVSI